MHVLNLEELMMIDMLALVSRSIVNVYHYSLFRRCDALTVLITILRITL